MVPRNLPFLFVATVGLLVLGCGQIASITGAAPHEDENGNTGLIATTSLPDAVEGTPYIDGKLVCNARSTQDVSWVVDAEELPDGLSLTDTGTRIAHIVGMPSTGSHGSYPLAIKLYVDGEIAAATILTLSVFPKRVSGKLKMTPNTGTFNIELGMAWDLDIEVRGGTGTYTWTITDAPPWLSVVTVNSALLFSIEKSALFAHPTAEDQKLKVVVFVEDSGTPHPRGAIATFEFTLPGIMMEADGWPVTLGIPYIETGIRAVDILQGRTINGQAGGDPYIFMAFNDILANPYLPLQYTVQNPTPKNWLAFDLARERMYGLPDAGLIEQTDIEGFDLIIADSNPDGPQSVKVRVRVGVATDIEITTLSMPPAREGEPYEEQILAVSSGSGTNPYGTPDGQALISVIGGDVPPFIINSGGTCYSGAFATGQPVPPLPYGTAGTYVTRILAEDPITKGRKTEADVTFTVLPGVLAIVNSPDLGELPQGMPFELALEAGGGSPPYHTWSSSALPSGLTLDPTSGVLSGTPDTITAAQSFTISVRDQGTAPATATFTYSVKAVPLAIDTSLLKTDAYKDEPYWGVLRAKGGTGGYVWRIFSGALPDNVTLDATTGHMRGAPTVAGTFEAVIEVEDSAANKEPFSLSIEVSASASPAGEIVGMGIYPPFAPLYGTPGQPSSFFDDKADGIRGNGRGDWKDGDGGPAYLALIWLAQGITFDSKGNLYVVDFQFHSSIRKINIDPATKKLNKYCVIETICGGRTMGGGMGGIGGPARDADIPWIGGMAMDGNDNLFFVSMENGTLFKIDLKNSTPVLELAMPDPMSQICSLPFALLEVNNKTGAATELYVGVLNASSAGSIMVCDLVSQTVTHVFHPMNYTNSASGIFVTKGGDLFIATESLYVAAGGLYKRDRTQPGYVMVDVPESEIEGTYVPGAIVVNEAGKVVSNGDSVSYMAYDPQGRLWHADGNSGAISRE